MIRVTFVDTGEVREFNGTLMVAPNGCVFIKQGSKTIFAATGGLIIAEEIQ
jgi:hypothetical protein